MGDSDDKLPATDGEKKLPSWVTSLPDNAKKSFIKLGKYLVGEGSYYFDHLSEKKQTNRAREVLTVKAAEHIAQNYGSDDPLAQRALLREHSRILGEQESIEDITGLALEDLSAKKANQFDNKEVDSDWLYRFYEHAKGFSSDEMKSTFAKILSGEIQKPGSFSPKTLETVATLSKNAGEVFVKAAACTFFLPGLPAHISARISSIGRNLGNNGLREYGLPYSNLVLLQEYGLVSNDLNSWNDYPVVLFAKSGFGIGAHTYRLNVQPKDPGQLVRLSGVMLTQVGSELFSVIDKETNAAYIEAFNAWLVGKIEQD